MSATASKEGQTEQGWAKPEAYEYEKYDTASEDPRGWDGSAKVYEWDGTQGDVGPEYPELEIELFGAPEDRNQVKGIDFSRIVEIELFQEGPVKVNPIASFDKAGLHPVMLKNVQMSGYDAPTPIQKFALPAIMQGYDVIGIAQTGSGKTAAYLIPILNTLVGKAKKLAAPRPNPAEFRVGIDQPLRAEPLVCIVVPTRELACQIFNEARKFCYRTMLRPCVCYGGGPVVEQLAVIGKGCDILIATPGRLVDFIQRPHALTFARLRYMVIDEADEMLGAGWENDFKIILSGGDQDEGNVKYMLFSATFPKAARELASEYLATSHVRFRVGRAGSSHQNIRQVILAVEPWAKKEVLMEQLTRISPCRTIIFVNNKRTADEVDDFLFNKGLPCTSMHADRTQLEREAAMRAFRAGRAPIMIATGVTARGIDVRNVMHVINYDLPSMEYGGIEEYTHRIGRTGRAGHRGMATSFYTDRDEPIAKVLTLTLLETQQEIPDFLNQYVPDGETLDFESTEMEATVGEDDGAGDAGENPWGSGENLATRANEPEPAWGPVAEKSAAAVPATQGGWAW